MQKKKQITSKMDIIEYEFKKVKDSVIKNVIKGICLK